MKMLVALQPFCGLSIAAADDRDRQRAFDLLADHHRPVADLGSPARRLARICLERANPNWTARS